MKVLITGAAGFVGSWMVKKCLDKGAEVFAFVRPESNLSRLSNLNCQICYGDVLDDDRLNRVFEDKDYVIHLAAMNSPHPKLTQWMLKTNTKGTENVAKACVKNNIKRLIHFSSVCTVGVNERPESPPLDEHMQFKLEANRFHYIQSKIQSENVILNYVKNYHLNAVVLNPSMMFGAGDGALKSREFQHKIIRGKIPFSPPGGTNIVSVHDVVEAAYQALSRGRMGERYILSGQNISYTNLLNTFASEAGARKPYFVMPRLILRAIASMGELLEKVKIPVPVSPEQAVLSTYFHWYDSSKAARELGYNCQSPQTAIKESVMWMKAHGAHRSSD